MRLVLSSPVFTSHAAVICLASFATTLTAGNQSCAKQVLVSKDALAIFLETFTSMPAIWDFCFSCCLLRDSCAARNRTMLFVLPVARHGAPPDC